MTPFYVKERLADGRVYLCPKEPTKDELLLETIKAKDWGDAREMLRPAGFDTYPRRPGYGFFNPNKGA